MRTEDFTVARGDIDLLRIGMMQADRHQRAVRLHLVEPLPGLANVAAAIERAVFRGRGNTQAGIKRVRILRRHLDIASIGEWRKAIHPQIFPGLALVLAAKDSHAYSKDHAVRFG